MATFTLLLPLKPLSFYKPKQSHLSSPKSHLFAKEGTTKTSRSFIGNISLGKKCKANLLGSAGLALSLTTLLGVGSSIAAEVPSLVGSSLQFSEPSNALSLPTWAVHVSSVVEWITAMALVWQYGEKSGNESWKGLSWGMILVALQAALTVIGNVTICIAAFRIYKTSEGRSKNL